VPGVGWLGTTGILAALRRRAIEGGSYRVVVSLTRTVLWQLSLGIFDKVYAQATAGSTDEHTYVAPDLFTAETPLGTYQGMTDQVVLSRTLTAPEGNLTGIAQFELSEMRNRHVDAQSTPHAPVRSTKFPSPIINRNRS
jgi:hypothetical protein